MYLSILEGEKHLETSEIDHLFRYSDSDALISRPLVLELN